MERRERDERLDGGDAGRPAGYTGPLRRRTDLPGQIESLKKGTLSIRTIHWILIALTLVISLVLFGTIKSERALLREALSAVSAAELAAWEGLQSRQMLLTAALVALVVIMIIASLVLIQRPITEFISRIRAHKTLPLRGAFELRYLAGAYNVMFEENLRHDEELCYRAEHDPLTGLYNRGAFEKLREAHQAEDVALLLIDMDEFKTVNDTYGHDVGDRLLVKAAGLLGRSFRSTDYPCRIGGDEFAVIMTGAAPDLRKTVLEKIDSVKSGLRDVSDGLPESTLSVGVAFSAQCREGDNLYHMADRALYRVKEAGRNGCAFYDPEETAEV